MAGWYGDNEPLLFATLNQCELVADRLQVPRQLERRRSGMQCLERFHDEQRKMLTTGGGETQFWVELHDASSPPALSRMRSSSSVARSVAVRSSSRISGTTWLVSFGTALLYSLMS